MNRFALCFVLLTAACGGSKSSSNGSSSLCDGPTPPAICSTTCDPTSGTGDATCGAGFHCASTGKCDAQCTATGGECGAGHVCSTDGFCNTDDGNGGGDDTPPIDAECPALKFTATHVTPSVELLIDKSQSMRDDFSDRDPNDKKSGAMPPYKFPTEQEALVGTNGVVTQLQNSVYFGAAMYPGATCAGAIFQTPRAMGNASAIATLIAAHGPSGNTPTADAVNAVVQDLMSNPPPAGSPAIIVLATDGLPNDCNKNTDIQPTIDAAANAFSKGIKLYLLSVGDKISDDFKTKVANAGQGVQAGQPDAKSYTATSPAELTAAFQEIIGGVVSCDLKLNGMVDANYASTGIVVLNTTTLTYSTDWTLDADGTTIHLLGSACQTLKTSSNPQLSATFACGSGVFF